MVSTPRGGHETSPHMSLRAQASRNPPSVFPSSPLPQWQGASILGGHIEATRYFPSNRASEGLCLGWEERTTLSSHHSCGPSPVSLQEGAGACHWAKACAVRRQRVGQFTHRRASSRGHRLEEGGRKWDGGMAMAGTQG